MPHFRLALPLAVATTAFTLPAQWAETGDAGNTPRSAQVPNGTIDDLPSITGAIASGDADMYLIEIRDPATFSATTVGGATFDTQLFLFRRDGRAVTHNDDASGSPQSTITGQFVPHPGLYYLAISSFDCDPLAAFGEVWLDIPYNVERRADGPRRGEAVDGWSAGVTGAGPYAIALTGCTRPGKEVVAPDNHHFSESATQMGVSGSTAWWRTGGGRFQVLYESSHFASAGQTSAMFIDKLMFRGEDGEPNLGGQSWANVTVRLATTAMTPATLGTDFAANLAAASNVSPVVTFATVAVAPSSGSSPNNAIIGLDLYNSPITGYWYVPTSGNLLIDVTLPTAATVPSASGPVMAIADTVGGIASVRGAGVTAASPTATTGALSTAPPVVVFKIDGVGGAPIAAPAANTRFGAACGGSPSTFYQTFANGDAFDLTGLTLTPDNPLSPNGYVVSAGAGAFDGTKLGAAPISTGDDSVVTYNLGFSFRFPGGVTNQVRPCTNGFVWLDGVTANNDFSPSIGELLGATLTLPARLAPCWYDFHAGRNTATHPNSGLHAVVDTAGGPGNAVCYLTWSRVGTFNTVNGTGIGGHAVYDMQCVLYEATGVVEFRYGTMPSFCGTISATNGDYAGIVGFTRGRIGATPSVDPQSRDLSVETPFATAIEGLSGNIGQVVKATPDVGGLAMGGRAYAGQTLTFDAVGVPAGAALGVQLLDFAQSVPGQFLPTITAPGCVLSTSLSPTLFQVSLFPPATVVGTVPVAVPAGVEGFELIAQYAVLDGLLGGPNLVTAASNAVRIKVGKK